MSEDVFTLNPEFSTTRRLTNAPTDSEPETALFLPTSTGRKGEGGLRRQGYFKRSFPGSPLVSIIVVVFNGERTLDRAIRSVYSQTYDNVELIVIDGGSTDETLAVIRHHENSLDYWVSEGDLGVYDAMNKGLLTAAGDWIYFLGCDDILAPQAIENMRLHEASPDSVVYGDVYRENRHALYGGRFSKFKLMYKNICHQAIFYGKNAIRGKRYELRYWLWADYFMNITLISEKEFIYRPVLVCLFNDVDGLTSNAVDDVFLSERKRIIKEKLGRFYLFLYFATYPLVYCLKSGRKAQRKLSGKEYLSNKNSSCQEKSSITG